MRNEYEKEDKTFKFVKLGLTIATLGLGLYHAHRQATKLKEVHVIIPDDSHIIRTVVTHLKRNTSSSLAQVLRTMPNSSVLEFR